MLANRGEGSWCLQNPGNYLPFRKSIISQKYIYPSCVYYSIIFSFLGPHTSQLTTASHQPQKHLYCTYLPSYLTYLTYLWSNIPIVFKDSEVYGVFLLSWLCLCCLSFCSFNRWTSFKVSSCLLTSFFAFQVVFGFFSLLGGLWLIFWSWLLIAGTIWS